MSRDFAQLLEHLRNRTAEVELDVPPPAVSAEASAAPRPTQMRGAAIRRGDRVAYLYKRGDGDLSRSKNGAHRHADLATSVTENESRALMAAGASWAGPGSAPMPRPHIERLRVRNFRCVQETELALTPLHALIGPNDSGKSTLLEVLRQFPHGLESGDATIVSSDRALTRRMTAVYEHAPDVDATDPSQTAMLRPASGEMYAIVHPSRLLRLDPDAMRESSKLIPHGMPFEYSIRGHGLAAVYDALLSRNIEVFLDISRRFKALFPTARSIRLTNTSDATKALGVELLDGRSIGPHQLSEGMLYWLAFAALPFLQAAPLILIEEPENGLHPSRIADVVGVLREISQTAQIIIATHHPLVINELQSDEVTIITRTAEHGTVATPLVKTKNFEQRSRVYALGELWLNYADGELESELVAESTLPSATG